MKITTYHDHDVGSFLHAGALAFTHTPELTPQPTAGADVVMQSGKTGSRAQGVERERWMRRDWIRAGMVGSGASRVGGWPRSRRVWEVMGPMVARVMVGGRARLAASRR